MEANLEGCVGSYLTRGGSVFVNPQFNVVWNKGLKEGGACPDFVALDFDKKHVVVAEVTTADNLKSLFAKVEQREVSWFRPIMRHLDTIGAVTPDWKPRFLGFVRASRVQTARETFAAAADVSFYPLEDALLEYSYSVQRKEGLP